MSQFLCPPTRVPNLSCYTCVSNEPFGKVGWMLVKVLKDSVSETRVIF